MSLGFNWLQGVDAIWHAGLFTECCGRSGVRQPEALHCPVHPANRRDERPPLSSQCAWHHVGQGLHPLFEAGEDRFQGGGEDVEGDSGVHGGGVLKLISSVINKNQYLSFIGTIALYGSGL